MAITKILHINEGKREKGRHLRLAIRYITKPYKTEGGRYIFGTNCQAEYAYEQMKKTKEFFGKTDKRQGYHIIISFPEDEVDPGTAFRFLGEFVNEYLSDEYESVYAIHTDTAHVHGHIIFNSVNRVTGNKYRYKKGDWEKQIQPITDRLCRKFGLSVLEIGDKDIANPSYRAWPGQEKNTTWSQMIRKDVDAAILNVDTMDEFFGELKAKGYEIKSGKHMAIKPEGMKRFRRIDELGTEYTLESIGERLKTENKHSYRRMSEAKIIRVRIPYHLKKAKLTGLQRQYFKKLYRIGVLRRAPYSKAWWYKDDIKKFKKLQEQYLFLARNEVHSLDELMEIKDKLIKEKQAEGADWRSIQRELKTVREIIRETQEINQPVSEKEKELVKGSRPR